MSDLNSVTLVGRVGADPQVRFTQGSTAVGTVRIAVAKVRKVPNGDRIDETSWVRVVFWDKLAETVERYVKKGDRIGVVGELRENRWTDKEGQSRSVIEVRAHSLQLLSPRPDDQGQSASRGSRGARPPPPKADAPDEFDDDIPF